MTPEQINTIRTSILFLIAPEFKTIDVDKLEIINSFIEFASEDVDPKKFGTRTNRGIALLTAHNLTVLNPLSLAESVLKTQSGTLIAKVREIDRVKKEDRYSSNSTSNNESMNSEYSGSQYGLQFFALKKSCKTFRGNVI